MEGADGRRRLVNEYNWHCLSILFVLLANPKVLLIDVSYLFNLRFAPLSNLGASTKYDKKYNCVACIIAARQPITLIM